MSIVELRSFPASDAFIADHSIINPALDVLAKIEGCRSTYHGLQAEDKKTGYLAVAWETYEHHQTMISSEAHGDFLNALAPSAMGESDTQHIVFASDPTVALSAPTTELASLKLKPGQSADALAALLRDVAEILLGVAECHSSAVGESREHSGRVVCAVGWESVEAHIGAVKAEHYGGIAGPLHSLTDGKVVHVSFVKRPV